MASVSKRWFRVRDSYGVEVAPSENDVLVLAVTVAIDQMTHDEGLSLAVRLAPEPRPAPSA